MDIDVTYSYPVTPQRLHAVLTDRAHVEAKNGADAGRAEIVEVSPHRIEAVRTVSATLPPIAARFVGESRAVRQIEQWDDPSPDGHITGSFSGAAPGLPVDVSGTLAIAPTPGGSTLRIRGTVKVDVPLVGGKIATLVREEVVKNLEREHTFTTAWLADH